MTHIDHTHDATAKSWVASAQGHPDFPIQNLPLGIFTPPGANNQRGGIAVGDEILDLGGVALHLTGQARAAAELAAQPTLNALLGAGPVATGALRQGVFALLTDPAKETAVRPLLYSAEQCTLHLPVKINDYTDFYTGIHHAENIGKQFRPDNPLLPNYKYVPIGYHGRSSSIRPSGVDVIRPNGQTKAPDAPAPSFGPSKRLDYELEMAIWVGRGNDLGKPIPIDEAGEHIAGISILNDWSARDIQAWEYQPLGPFLSKNFHSTVSPWIVTTEALAPYRIAQPPRPADDPASLPYLLDPADQAAGAYAIMMEVHILTEQMRTKGYPAYRLSHGPMTAMYWTAAQLIAHHTVNGCNLAPGDLIGTGTLSYKDPGSFGSLMELSVGGKHPITINNGEIRSFIEDGDEIILTAYAQTQGRARIGFGECRAKVIAQ